MTPVPRYTRAVYLLGVCLTLGTGIGLFAFPGRTPDYWAWTIKAPPTAVFFGAGYIGAALVERRRGLRARQQVTPAQSPYA